MTSRSWTLLTFVPLTVLLGSVSGCTPAVEREAVARVLNPEPTIRSTSSAKFADGEPSIETNESSAGTTAYRIRIPVRFPETSGAERRESRRSEFRAAIEGPGSMAGPLEINSVDPSPHGAIEMDLRSLPPGAESVRLIVESGNDQGIYQIDGLRTLPERPRLPSRVTTSVGVIEAIGLRDSAERISPHLSYGGIALRLPWCPGFVRRLRKLETTPAYMPSDGSSLATYVDPTRIPAVISGEGFGASRWEARGFLDLFRVIAEGDARSASAPVAVTLREPDHRSRSQAKPQWRIVAKGTLPEDQDIQVRVDRGPWQAISDGIYLQSSPGRVLYRMLQRAKSVPFAVQADAINEVHQIVNRKAIGTVTMIFDYDAELDRQAQRDGHVSIIR